LCLLLLVIPQNIYIMENPSLHLVSSTYYRLLVAILWMFEFMEHVP
jgi:hypothetical protein